MPSLEKNEASHEEEEDEVDEEEEEEEEDDEVAKTPPLKESLRHTLKIIRDSVKNAFDILPSGETLGAFANKQAVECYARKIERKRERARETRQKKKQLKKGRKKEQHGRALSLSRKSFSS
jgi:hypothetical protein